MLAKTKDIRKKNVFSKIQKKNKMYGHIAQGKQQLKFERNPCNSFRDNRCHRQTDDGRTTDDGRISIS